MDEITKNSTFFTDVLVLDTETTGVEPTTDDIIEFSASFKSENSLQNYTTKIKTDLLIPPESSAIHFITNNDLTKCAKFETHTPIIDGLLDSFSYYCGHNVKFDKDMMIGNYYRHTGNVHPTLLDEDKWIDTYSLAKHLYSQDDTVSNLKLSYLWFRFGLNVDGVHITPHSAEDDVFMCFELLKFLVKECINRGIINTEDDIGLQLVEYIKTPIEYLTMPWGKFKGKEFCELETYYLEWLVTSAEALQEDKPAYDADLAFTVEKEFNRRLELV